MNKSLPSSFSRSLSLPPGAAVPPSVTAAAGSPAGLPLPPAALAVRRQMVPPPRNPYLESQWEKLSASMANLNTYKKVRVKKRIILLEERKGFCRLNFIFVNKKLITGRIFSALQLSWWRFTMRFDDRKFLLLGLFTLHIVRKFIRYKTEMIANLQIFRMTRRTCIVQNNLSGK